MRIKSPNYFFNQIFRIIPSNYIYFSDSIVKLQCTFCSKNQSNIQISALKFISLYSIFILLWNIELIYPIKNLFIY